MAPIEVEDLTKVYDEDVVANDALTFDVESGEVFGFLGPNGAGKTTCIRTLMGFQSPTEGTARVLGADVRDAEALREARAGVGYLPAHPSFDDDVTGRTFLEYQAELKGGSRRDELLEVFTPPLDRPIGEYSTGNAQMLAIVQAFMHDPDLVIMDEPTSGLDPLKQEAFNDFLRDERDDGVSVFFSSHILAEVRRVCDRVGIIRNGRLAALKSVDDLLGRSGKRVRVLIEQSPSERDFDWEGVVDLEVSGQETKFTFTGDTNELIDHLSTFDVLDIEIDEPPLEEIFMHFYGEAADPATAEPAGSPSDVPDGSASDGSQRDTSGGTNGAATSHPEASAEDGASGFEWNDPGAPDDDRESSEDRSTDA